MTIHYTTTEWNSKKIIVGESELKPDQPSRLLIGFHGADSTPENMLVHGNKLKLSNTLYVYPEGPIDASNGLWSWWKDGPRQSQTVKSFLEYAAEVVDTAHHFLKDKSEHPPQVCLWGFSQGGAAALVYSMVGSHALHKVASVCGFLPEIPEDVPNQIHNTSIFGIYGLNDEVIPSFLAEYALEELEGRGHSLTVKETPQGHEVNAANITDLIGFFESEDTPPL